MCFPAGRHAERVGALVPAVPGVAAVDRRVACHLPAEHQTEPKMPAAYEPSAVQIRHHIGHDDQE